MKNEDRVKFDSSFRQINGTWYMKISPNLADWLGLEEERVEAVAQAEVSEHGKYVSGWRKDQGEE